MAIEEERNRLAKAEDKVLEYMREKDEPIREGALSEVISSQSEFSIREVLEAITTLIDEKELSYNEKKEVILP